MNKLLLIIVFLVSSVLFAQETKAVAGPILMNYGKVYQVENADLLLKKNIEYKVIFDIYSDNSNGKGINSLLNTVARYLNMHAQQGIFLKNMKVAVVLHGSATKNVLNNEAYVDKFEIENPNLDLLQQLKKNNVELFVCGQSFLASDFAIKELSGDVKIALSALTTLVEYQQNGYHIINFN
ncbi:DsrE family protein [Lutibacter sp.]|uniref:DsrE family protein n=1 Tax=Lutibacter sp. TaxID=1925666 RepID=UPI0027367E87|nr:DsrE family protein [Lutibacter sp.]MDP3313231.1 DsrE family protein [Lutibacter sp.]